MSPATPRPAKLLAHNVFFTLHDRSEAARAKLMRACQEWLAPHPGIVFFACGTLAEALKREVNDRDFDVGLHIIFTNQAAHDHYQETPEHQRFIAENKPNWKRVRVFDSVATPSPATAP
jgi:hypothetical protein